MGKASRMYFDSRRSTVLATNGMVATSQPLAAMAGLQALMDGGNAVDAAITAAAALNVVEPNSTGVGGDLFALVWNEKEKSVRAINGSGRAAAAFEHRGADVAGLPGHARRRALLGVRAGDGARLGDRCGPSAAACPCRVCWSPPSATPRTASRCPRSSRFSGRISCPSCAPTRRGRRCWWTGTPRGRATWSGSPRLQPRCGPSPRAAAKPSTTDPSPRRWLPFVQEHGGWLTTEDLAAHHLRLGRADHRRLPGRHLLGMPSQRAGHRRAGGPEHRRGLRHRRHGSTVCGRLSPPDRGDAARLRRRLPVRGRPAHGGRTSGATGVQGSLRPSGES